MRRGQTLPRTWLIIAGEHDAPTAAARRLPPGSGILLLSTLSPGELRRLRRLARSRSLVIASE